MGNHWTIPNSIIIAITLALVLFRLESAGALKCRTEDGPSSDEIRKVIRICMKRISSDSENKSSNEYENYDSSYSDTDSGENRENSTEGRQISGRGGGKMTNTRGRNGEDTGRGNDPNRNSDNRRADGRNRQNNGRRRDRDRDYDYGPMGRRMDDGRNQHGRYKRQYYNDGSQSGYGYNYQQNDHYNHDRNNFMYPNNTSPNGTNSTERDRACLMQCFFQEMKMTTNEGFPDKHKVLHVVTKDLRDYELRDFYTDSIQECFHMISMDNKLKDKCDYSMKFVMCLADRGQANCNDWENEAIMF